MKVIFWNVARTGAAEGTLSTDMLCEDLGGLCERWSPDAVVLCECLLGFRERMGWAPASYSLAPIPNPGLYTSESTLRYALFRRDGAPLRDPLLVRTGPSTSRLRPALAFSLGATAYLALHAASITRSNAVQVGQMVAAWEALSARGRKAEVIVGDMNVDLGSGRRDVLERLAGTPLEDFAPRGPKGATHRAGSTLDWALLGPGARSGRIRALRPTARSVEEKARDRWLRLEFENRKGSDHIPVMVTI